MPAIKSSVFRVEPAQDYTDLRLDFTSPKIMTEYGQSQSLLDHVASSHMPVAPVHGGPKVMGAKQVRIKNTHRPLKQSPMGGAPLMRLPGGK